MSKARQILEDLNKELSGQLLSDTFSINGRDYEMRLLTDAEIAWSYSMLRSINTVVLTITSRVAALSVGIRSIDGCAIKEIFEDEHKEIVKKRKELYENYEKLKEDEREDLESFLKTYEGLEGSYLDCKIFFDWLGNNPSTFIDSLYKEWTGLIKRQGEMQESVKKSLQESSEISTEQNSTELSQSGGATVQSSE